MSVFLEPDEEDRWLEEDDPEALQAMYEPFPSERTRIPEVSTAINNPAKEGPELVESVGNEQAGLGEFS